MSSIQRFTDCPMCGYYGAEDYAESSGERFITCEMCGYVKNESDFDPSYFDSEEEIEEHMNELDKQNYTPTKNEIKNVGDFVKFANMVLVEYLHEYFDVVEIVDKYGADVRNGGDYRVFVGEYIKNNKSEAYNTIKGILG